MLENGSLFWFYYIYFTPLTLRVMNKWQRGNIYEYRIQNNLYIQQNIISPVVAVIQVLFSFISLTDFIQNMHMGFPTMKWQRCFFIPSYTMFKSLDLLVAILIFLILCSKLDQIEFEASIFTYSAIRPDLQSCKNLSLPVQYSLVNHPYDNSGFVSVEQTVFQGFLSITRASAFPCGYFHPQFRGCVFRDNS